MSHKRIDDQSAESEACSQFFGILKRGDLVHEISGKKNAGMYDFKNFLVKWNLFRGIVLF